jgi:hypothetical protein
LAQQLLRSRERSGRSLGRALAAPEGSVEELVDEVVRAHETPGKFAEEPRAATATPSVETAGIAAGFGQLSRE